MIQYFKRMNYVMDARRLGLQSSYNSNDTEEVVERADENQSVNMTLYVMRYFNRMN